VLPAPLASRGSHCKRCVCLVAGPVALLAGLCVAPATAATPVYTQAAINSPLPEATTFQGFGVSLASAGDPDGDGIPEIVASDASQPVGGLPDAGRAWIIDGQSHQVLTTLTSPAPQAGAGFGSSAIDIGVVGGIDEVAVGAPGQDVYTGTGSGCGQPPPNGCNLRQGEVYVFNAATGALLFTIDDPDPQSVGADFGHVYLAAPGDLNGDGVPDLVVTAPGQDDGPMFGSGRAFAFSGKDGSLLYKLHNPNPEAGAAFGDGISVPGDLTGDGVHDLVIGAPGATGDGQPGEGRAYVFDGSTGALIRTLDDPAAQAPGPFGGASFGSDLGSAGAPGDINGDGVPDIYVAATGQNAGGLMGAGEGFIFSGSDGSLLRVVDGPAEQAGAGFGWALANAGDPDGDGGQDLLVGQFSSADPGGYSAGAWVLDGATGNVLTSFPGSPFGPGDTLAAPGDVSGDGCPDYFLGGPSLGVGSNQFQGQIIVELSHANPGCRTTSTAVACSPGAVSPGARTVCTITVADTDQGPVSYASGAVTVSSSHGGAFTPAAACTLAATATAGRSACQLAYTAAAVGTGARSLTAAYPGDANHAASTASATVAVVAAVAPKVTGFHVTRSVFVVGPTATSTTGVAAASTKHRPGTSFVYRLSQPATVKIVIAQRLTGRRPRVRGTLTRRSHRGANEVAFSGRINAKALAPGGYAATLTATGAAGNASRPVTITFTIVAR
jgi:hypothetical protein